MSRSDRFFAFFFEANSLLAPHVVLFDFLRVAQYTLLPPGHDTTDMYISGKKRFGITKTALEEAVQSGERVAFSIWSKSSEGLFITLFRDEDLVCLDFSLDGTTQDQEAGLIDAAVSMFENDYNGCALAALVIDPTGEYAEMPWPQVLRGGHEVRFSIPARLLVSNETHSYLDVDLLSYTAIRVNERALEIVCR